MSLERAIHDRWRSCRPLTAIVPPERVFTGRHRGQPALPYVVVERREDQESLRTSGGFLYRRTRLAFVIVSLELGPAKTLVQLIRARFDRRDFRFEGGYCLDLRWSSQQETLGDDDVWTVQLDYLAMQELAAAA